MGAYRSKECTGTVSSIDDAFSELQSLGEECREVVDNSGDQLANTSRIQTLDETASTLENFSEFDIPECVAEVAITYTELEPTRKGRAASRVVRRDNAVAVLRAALDVLEEWQAEQAAHDDIEEVEELARCVSEMVDDAEGCEFPGMYDS